MIVAQPPKNESERLAELHAYRILDSLPEQVYDDITFLASQICSTPIALISLVDSDRQWFKSRIGLEVDETPRDLAFCAHAILEPERLLEVPNAVEDDRFSGNPLVRDDPSIRFYAGAPLKTARGVALGTLCVIDRQPRELSPDQRKSLMALSRQVMGQLDLRKAVVDLQEFQARLESYQTKLEQANAALATESRTDALTGLANRAAFDVRLDEEIHRAERHKQPLALLMMDVDHFKAFNDEFGHPAGDEVLRTVARLVRERSRQSDYPARVGGEEFAVILTNTALEGAAILAERFRRAIERGPWAHRPITLSVGVAVADDENTSSLALLDLADRALYRAKGQGRNRVAETVAETA